MGGFALERGRRLGVADCLWYRRRSHRLHQLRVTEPIRSSMAAARFPPAARAGRFRISELLKLCPIATMSELDGTIQESDKVLACRAIFIFRFFCCPCSKSLFCCGVTPWVPCCTDEGGRMVPAEISTAITGSQKCHAVRRKQSWQYGFERADGMMCYAQQEFLVDGL